MPAPIGHEPTSSLPTCSKDHGGIRNLLRDKGNRKSNVWRECNQIILDSHCHLERFPNPKAVAADAARRGVFTIAVTNLQAISERIATRFRVFLRLDWRSDIIRLRSIL